MVNEKQPTAKQTLGGVVALIRAFRRQIMREKGMLLFALLAVRCSLACQILAPWPLKYIYDAVFRALGGRGRTTLPAVLTGLSPQSVILVGTIAMVVIVFLGAASEYLSTVYLTLAASRILTRIRAWMFGHVSNLSISFHDRAKTGDLITRVVTDVDRIRDVILTAALPFATNALVLLAMIGVMFWMNWRLALVSLVVF